MSKYLQILQRDSVKPIFNFRFTCCTTAGCSGSSLVCMLVWKGCLRKAGRNVTTETTFLKAGIELLSKCNVSVKGIEKLNSVVHACSKKH